MLNRTLTLAVLFSALATFPACRTATQTGVLTGGAVGAGSGLLAAELLGKSHGGGALIGAGVGALVGGLTGHAIDHAPRGGVVFDNPTYYAPPQQIVTYARPVHVAPVYAAPAPVYRLSPGLPPPRPMYAHGGWQWTGSGWVWLDG